MSIRPLPRAQEQQSEPKRSAIAEIASWAVIVVAFIVLLAIVIGSPSHPVYDEGFYLASVDVLERYGLSAAFLRDLPGPAGPTFTVVFAFVSRSFGLGLPWLRLVNVGFMAGSAALLYGAMRAQVSRGSQFKTPPALAAGTLIVVPTIGVSAGMTLTEMPALFFVSAFLFAVARIDPDAEPHGADITSAVASGFALGAAVLGRQNYLLILPCLALLATWHNAVPARSTTLVLVLIFFSAAVTVVPVFVVWGGLVPPTTAWVGHGLSVWNGILSAGYAGIILALIAPDVYRPLIDRPSRPLAILFVAIGLAFFCNVPVTPMRLVLSFPGPMISSLSATGFTFLICLLAVAFLAGMALHLQIRWGDRFLRFCGCVMLAVMLSNMKITHQFSSRYVAVSLPFLIASVAPSIRVTPFLPVRLVICACLSLASLISYFYG